MKFNYIDSGEVCALQAIEITSIPDISILLESADTNINSAEYINRAKNNFSNLLNEIFLAFKGSFNYELLMQDIALELIWYTDTVVSSLWNCATGSNKSKLKSPVRRLHSVCGQSLFGGFFFF